MSKRVLFTVIGVAFLVLVGIAILVIRLYFYFPSSLSSTPLNRPLENFPTPSEIQNINLVQPIDASKPSSEISAFYHGVSVGRVDGTFVSFIGDRFLQLKLAAGKKTFFVESDSEFVCQPTGKIDVGGQSVPAQGVFIDDRRSGNFGIPWGVSVKRQQINSIVNQGAETLVYYRPDPFAIIPSIVYVWFKSCDI